MTDSRSIKKPLLYALIASVILGATLGIIFVLRNTWGWFEVRVMLTTMIIAVASLCGLACDLSKIPSGLNLLPRAGLALTAITSCLFLVGIWIEIDSEFYWRGSATLCTFALATVHVSLLSIARLVGKFRWVSFIGNQIVYGLAVLVSITILGEVDSGAMWRFIAALSIVVAAITLVIPILYRIGRIDSSSPETMMPLEQRNVASIDEEIVRLKEQIVRLEELKARLLSPSATG